MAYRAHQTQHGGGGGNFYNNYAGSAMGSGVGKSTYDKSLERAPIHGTRSTTHNHDHLNGRQFGTSDGFSQAAALKTTVNTGVGKDGRLDVSGKLDRHGFSNSDLSGSSYKAGNKTNDSWKDKDDPWENKNDPLSSKNNLRSSPTREVTKTGGGYSKGGHSTGGYGTGGYGTGGYGTGSYGTGGYGTGSYGTGGYGTGGYGTGGYGTGGYGTGGYDYSSNSYESSAMDWSPSYGGTRNVSSWSSDDMKQYRQGYPGKIDNLHVRENAKFYLGQRVCKPDGVHIDDMHRTWFADYAKLERNHGFIQWIFPIREHGMNSESYELGLHEAEEIKKDVLAKKRFVKSYEMMLDFYGFKLVDKTTGEVARSDKWESRLRNLNISSHNNLRITRILKSLGEFGFEHYKIHLVLALLRECTEEGTIPNCKRSCYEYWSKTLRNTQDAERAQEEADFLEEVMNNEIVGPSRTSEGNAEFVFWKQALSPEASRRFEEEVRTAAQSRRQYLQAKQWRKIFGSSNKKTGGQTSTLNERTYGTSGGTSTDSRNSWDDQKRGKTGQTVQKHSYSTNKLGQATTKPSALSTDETRYSTKVQGYRDAVQAIMNKLKVTRDPKDSRTMVDNIKAVMAEQRSVISRSRRNTHDSQLLKLWQKLLSVCQ